jgi:hypothetical protein
MYKVFGVLAMASALAYVLTEQGSRLSFEDDQSAAISRIMARATILEPELVAAEQPGLRRPVTSPAATYVSLTEPIPAISLPAGDASVPTPDWQTTMAASADAATPAPDVLVQGASLEVQRQLARQIQIELKRVGCYGGRIDGSWGDRSREAMVTFMARVNAVLPTREPDVFLLSLIKGQVRTVCDADCNRGLVSSNGRCMAATQVASAIPAAAADEIVVSSTVPPVAPQVRLVHPEPLPGRMSIGGPVSGDTGPVAPVTAAPITDEAATAWPAPATDVLPWATRPAVKPVLEPAMAALEPGDGAVMAYPAIPLQPKIAKSKKSWASAKPKPVKRRVVAARSVQQLFLYPLGRM